MNLFGYVFSNANSREPSRASRVGHLAAAGRRRSVAWEHQLFRSTSVPGSDHAYALLLYSIIMIIIIMIIPYYADVHYYHTQTLHNATGMHGTRTRAFVPCPHPNVHVCVIIMVHNAGRRTHTPLIVMPSVIRYCYETRTHTHRAPESFAESERDRAGRVGRQAESSPSTRGAVSSRVVRIRAVVVTE